MHLALSESSGDKNWAVRILSKMGVFPGEVDSSCFSSHMLNKRPSGNYLMPLFFFFFYIFVICIGGFPVLKWPQVQHWSCLSRVCKCKKLGSAPSKEKLHKLPSGMHAVGWEFSVNESTEYFKQAVFKQKQAKNMVKILMKILWPEAHRCLSLCFPSGSILAHPLFRTNLQNMCSVW